MRNKDGLIKILDLMLKIRMASETIVEVYQRDQSMRTPTHLSIGQEAVAAALAVNLNADDQLFAGHRCHSAFLAKGGDLNAFFAELCGRSTGVCGGRAGSAHLTDARAGIFASPILSAMIPVAVGAALSFNMSRSKQVAVTMFGDAAIEEGVFAESVNFAVTKKLPVLFVCENNLYSTHSPLSVRQPPSPIFERVAFKEFHTQQVDGNDVLLLDQVLGRAIADIRETGKPQFIECLTYRVREHVGPLTDHDRGYRTLAEVESWKAKCPIARLTRLLTAENILTVQEIEQMSAAWKQRSDAAYKQALNDPWPEVSQLTAQVY